MKFTHRHILTIAASALISLGACSDSDNTGSNPLQGVNVHFNINLSVPTGEKISSRSQTTSGGNSTDGTEQGAAQENAINNLLIVLADTDGNTLCVPSGKPSATDESTLSATIAIPLENLSGFIGKSDISLYALANYGATVNTSGFNPGNAIYSAAGSDDALLSPASGLPMSNRDIRTVTIPAMTDLVSYMSGLTPLDLTASAPLKLERSIARIDYLDGSKDKNHTFPITTGGATAPVPSGYELTLSSMELFNIGKKAYIFRHTSSDGSEKNLSLLGEENSSTFIMDCDASLKRGNGNDLPAGHFMKRSFTTADINGSPKSATSGYHILCYIPENTIPAADKQLQGYTTGSRFRFKITKAPEGTDINGTTPITVDINGKSLTVDYDTDGYYLDYYYFIKHNDNDDPESMGPMEFGITRNNIYRLKIESINGLPEPYDPEKPDEDPKCTLALKIRVAKWHYEKIIFDM